MDIFRRLLCIGISSDCNTTVDEEIPRVDKFFQQIETAFLIPICIGLIMTATVLILGIVHWVFVLKFISNEQIRTDMYWLVFMGPVVSLCGAIGMIVPRAAIFLYAIALVYFMICIFVLVCLMTTLNGSRRTMCEKMIARNMKISLQVCPLGCCFCCFAKLVPNEYNFRRIEWLVFQSPIVRIFLEVLNIIVFMEIDTRANLFFQISNLIGIISLFIGSYGSYMIIPAGSLLLKDYRFLLLFRLVDFSQLAWSVQKFVVEFLAFPRLRVFNSQMSLPATAQAQFCTSFLLCLEMLIVSLLATWLFRPSKTWLFDKFRHTTLGGGRCRIADASFLRNVSQCPGEFAGFKPDAAIGNEIAQPQQFNDGMENALQASQTSLRLEQVLLNGNGHTVSTAVEDDASLYQRHQRHRQQQHSNHDRHHQQRRHHDEQSLSSADYGFNDVPSSNLERRNGARGAMPLAWSPHSSSSCSSSSERSLPPNNDAFAATNSRQRHNNHRHQEEEQQQNQWHHQRALEIGDGEQTRSQNRTRRNSNKRVGEHQPQEEEAEQQQHRMHRPVVVWTTTTPNDE